MADLTQEYTPDQLWAGPARKPGNTMTVTVAQGEKITRGTLVTMDASTKTVKAVTAKTQAVFGVACEDVDASTKATGTVVYIEGEFNAKYIKLGTVSDSSTVADYVVSARNVGIILRNLQELTWLLIFLNHALY